MTASEFAQLVHARPSGKGKWTAKCPAHRDRLASLSIGVGRDGRVLLHCFAGCEHEAVLGSLGLQPRDLFPDRPCDPRAVAAARKMTARLARREAADRKRKMDAAHFYRNTLDQVDMLGRKLARRPDDGVLAQRFEAALDRQRQMEVRNGWE